MATVDPGMDLYQLLEVDPSASTEQITRAYRRLARRWHPDVATDPRAAERFAQMTTAFRVLADPAARARYDAGQLSGSRRPRPRPTRRTGASEGRRRPSWAGPNTRTGAAATFWLGGPTFTRAFTLDPQAEQHAKADVDVDAEVDVTVEEACTGTGRTLTVAGPHGTATVPVTIPPGVVTGQRLHVPVDHLPGGHGGQPVVLQVRLAEHQRYRVEGRHVHVDLPLTPWEAALGGPVLLETPTGPLHLQVPPGTSSGTVLTVPAGGLPNPAGRPGDLCAHVAVVVPSRLNAIERRLFTELARTSTFHPRTGCEP